MKVDNRNLLVSCGGKWVGMVLQLREAMARHDQLAGGRLIVASSDLLTPAGCFADSTVHVPPIKDPDYIDRLLQACVDHAVAVVVPLIDLDLARLAPHTDRFAAVGTSVICPSPELVALCFDKLAFAQFADAHDLPHPTTRTVDGLDDLRFPAYYKRRLGFGSIGSGVCASVAEARALAAQAPDLLFQDYLPVQEYTIDAYISRRGECIVCVPRVRDKVVGGESYKSHTIREAPVTTLAMRTIAALSARGLRGPLNVQIFGTQPPSLIEVNTRLGSASVLSNVASQGRLLDAILHEATGGTAVGDSTDYTVGLALSRFLGDVFHTEREVVAVKPR